MWYGPEPKFTIPDGLLEAWDQACLAAFQRGERPVINMPIGLISPRVKALRNEWTGEPIEIRWLPSDRFPSDLPAQYFNPDLILQDEP